MPSVLIVDDEPNIRRMVGALLAGEGYEVRDAPDGASGVEAARAHEPDVALVDLMMPGAVDGLGVLERLRERLPDLPVVMMSGRAALGDAVRATKLGAFTFLEKPLTPEGVLLALGSALELRRARREARALREEIGLGGAMVGDSPAMREVRALVQRVGPTDARVLVTGESGTGKELVAAGLHAASARRERPFVRVNCAAIPRDLVESEMFGHERGAFTGATERRTGRFELAHTGTLFLDEVGDLGAEAQAKLLRALEAGEIERVGGGRAIRVDVRIVSATNKELLRAVAEGLFREDLFFRLNVIPIHLPPLRERPGDVALLIRHFSALYHARTGRPAPGWGEDALALVERHAWPGNVRELANVVERLAILHPGGEVRASDVRRVLGADDRGFDRGLERGHESGTPARGTTAVPAPAAAVPARELGPLPEAAGLDVPLADALDAYERTLIVRALSAAGGNVTDAARRLRTDRPNLYRRMRRLAIPLAVLLAALAGGDARGAGAQTPRPAPNTRPDTTANTTPNTTRAPNARADTLAGSVSDGVADALARYNAPAALRVRGRFVVPAGSAVSGDVAVFGGPVTVAGRIGGRLTVLNGDLTFRPGARVDGDVLVVGGLVEGRRGAQFGGELRIERTAAAVAFRGDTLALDRAALGPDATDRREARFRLGGAPSPRTYAGFMAASGGAYNRVEGLPILSGPTFEAQLARDARLSVDLLGVYRTAGEFRTDAEHRGHDARAEVRFGRRRHVRVGGRLYDVVAPVEDWQLSPTETGVSSFVLRRDFRDWYGRHGAALTAGADLGPDAVLAVGYADERWTTRGQLNPATILRGREQWRPNPLADEGRLHLLTAGVRLDTRNDVARPWAGWYVAADYEYGRGGFDRFAPVSADLVAAGSPPATGPTLPIARLAPPGARDERPGRRGYGRGFLDVRRYNRLTPDAQLNLRLVAGGWLHGDALPAQRRLSVNGPGAIAGYSFRQAAGREGFDVAQCSVNGLQPPGDPAQCERVALGQVEYRTDVRVGLFTREEGGEGEGRRVRRGLRTEFTWVVFADAGRGWLVGPRSGLVQYPAGRLPALGTALADLGGGVDFGHPHGRGDVGTFGLYLAKSVTRPDRPLTFVLRLRRRF